MKKLPPFEITNSCMSVPCLLHTFCSSDVTVGYVFTYLFVVLTEVNHVCYISYVFLTGESAMFITYLL